jgi:hypothetical protein
MKRGTAHFRTLRDAELYYDNYGFEPADVREKIERGEVSLGAPDVSEGESLVLDTDGRYHIEEEA